jgi:DNA-binding Lrp family transcriptional regulator
MIRAVMLFRSGGRVPKAVSLAKQLKSLEFVTDAYAVFGRFDIVAHLEGRDVKELFRSVSEATSLEGIMSSETLIEPAANQQSPEYGKGPFSS